ncbi:Ssl2069 protein [Geminocystis sp. NIES-3708]|uniref:hypothetical protein n=1 Tax=Geminocystis sp. NIES-3708 TaxID=1615909 RepID=UPI0005FC7374|nr:hypothetical protein [Geminocystis sp. NIES-3708]BAQ60964.1 Ssl2069 protein [Geminocystis sp. NIES-3708]
MKENLLTWLDRFLVADVFLVIIGFVWFIIALILKSLDVSLPWEIWYQLWQPVFNPAIDILFIGALLSWIIKKIGQKLNT